MARLFMIFLCACDNSSGSDISTRCWGKEERLSQYNLYYETNPSANIDSAGNAMVTWQQTDMMTSTIRIASNRYTKGDGCGNPRIC